VNEECSLHRRVLYLLRSLAVSSSASRSRASLSRLDASSFAFCSLISWARFAIAILARSSFVRNLG